MAVSNVEAFLSPDISRNTSSLSVENVRVHAALEPLCKSMSSPMQNVKIRIKREAENAALKRVRFSVDLTYVECKFPFLDAEEFGNLWWSQRDFKRFRKCAKKVSQSFVELSGDLKVVEEVLYRAKTIATICGNSEWTLCNDDIEETFKMASTSGTGRFVFKGPASPQFQNQANQSLHRSSFWEAAAG